MEIQGLIFSYIFISATLFLLFVLIYLTVKIIKSSKKLNETIKEEKIISIDSQITKQNLIFVAWLSLLKFLGVFLPLLLSLKITFDLLHFFRSIIVTRSFDFMLFASTMEVFLISNEVFLAIAIFPWFLYFIFSFILQKRILMLKRIQAEMQIENKGN